MHPIVFLPVFITMLMFISACTAPKGGIVILENPNDRGVTMDFTDWSSTNKCGLFLNKGDELHVEVACEKGVVALLIRGKNGSEPYVGNNLRSMGFTVTVSEMDQYEILITGKNATGRVRVTNMGVAARLKDGEYRQDGIKD